MVEPQWPLQPPAAGLDAAWAARLAQLPSLPQVVLDVLRALDSSDLSTLRCVALIEQDPALAASTLRLANSAFYGVSGRVANIDTAVRLMGLRAVAGLLAAVALRRALGTATCPGFDFAAYWQHAVATALAARALAPRFQQDGAQAFLTGLVHDIGHLAMATFEPDALGRALAYARQQVCSLVVAEQAVLGLTHHDLGGWMAERWCFPPDMVAAIRLHHRPTSSPDGPVPDLTALVHGADALTRSLARAASPLATALPSPLRRSLGMTEAELQALCDEVTRGAQALCEVLQVG